MGASDPGGRSVAFSLAILRNRHAGVTRAESTTVDDLVNNPAFPRALVIGAFGGAGLTLTALGSRRGPLIYPVYAAILAALALLLARYPDLSYVQRWAAALAGFLVASAALYVTVVILADGERRRLVVQGRLPATALRAITLGGHAWRLGFLLAIGTLVSAAVAFVAA